MSTAPVITIFVRHSAGCKWAGDEFAKRCNCRKHFRWFQNGTQYRRKASTRSWAEAENRKRALEDELAGRVPVAAIEPEGQMLAAAVKSFLHAKTGQGISKAAHAKYKLELSRLQAFQENAGQFTVRALTLDRLTAFRARWTDFYPSSYSRAVAQKRLKTFLRYCYDAGWLDRIPRLSPVKVDEPETEPLTADEYARLLEKAPAGKIRAVIQLMRWSGLAVRDASTLQKSHVVKDKSSGLYRIIRARTKTKTPLYIPIPEPVALVALAAGNGSEYLFWDERKITALNFANSIGQEISGVFDLAGIVSEGNMVSHRLRATFAVDLLQKGVPLEHVSKLLGDRTVMTTERHYARWIKGRQALLDKIVSATWETK
jgi:site-specific recombinase XerD